MTRPFTLAHSPSFPQRVFLRLMGSTIPTGGEIAPDVTRFANSYSTSYAVAIGNGKFILIDSGPDKKATEILGFLASQNATFSDVEAIFITHAHPDHFAGLKQFPHSKVYISEHDKLVLEGVAPCDGFFPKLAGVLKEPAVADTSLIHVVADEQVVAVGNKQIVSYAVPGHTQGSVVYLTSDVLFVGDALTYGKNKAIKPPVPMSFDSELGIQSLRKLVAKFSANGTKPRVVLPAHSGEGTFESLKKLTD